MPANFRPTEQRSFMRPDFPVLNTGSAQAVGLVSWFSASPDRSGIRDQMKPTLKALLLSTSTPVKTALGPGWDCSANGLGARVASIASQNGLLPMSFSCFYFQKSTPVSNAALCGVTYTSTDTAPFWQYGIVDAAGTGVRIVTNSAGVQVTGTAFATYPVNGAFHLLVATVANGSQKLYIDGKVVVTDTAAITSISSVTPQVGIGQQTSDVTTRNFGSLMLDFRLYKRTLTDQDVRAMWSPETRWDLYAWNRQPAPWFAPAAAAGGADTPQAAQFTLMGVM